MKNSKGHVIFGVVFGIAITAYVVSMIIQSGNATKPELYSHKSSEQHQSSKQGPRNSLCVIPEETFAATTEEDFGKLVKYSVNKETSLVRDMVLDGRVVILKAGTEVRMEDPGIMKCKIRIADTESELWTAVESVKCQ